MSILVLKSAVTGSHSKSNALLDAVIAEHSQVTVRDLGRQPLPMLDEDTTAALRGDPANHTAQQQAILALSDTLLDEYAKADTLVIGAPVYNFTIPTTLKNWLDMITRARVSFRYTETGPVGLLGDKKVVVVITSGGQHRGTSKAHSEPYLTTMFNFIGINDIHFVYAEGVNQGDGVGTANLATAQSELLALLA